MDEFTPTEDTTVVSSTYVPGYGIVEWTEHQLDITATYFGTTHQPEPLAAGLRRFTYRRRCICCGQPYWRCREAKWARGRKQHAAQQHREMAHA